MTKGRQRATLPPQNVKKLFIRSGNVGAIIDRPYDYFFNTLNRPAKQVCFCL